jgi:protein-S-isoprenylcysteine O-methyltransferase Ste14
VDIWLRLLFGIPAYRSIGGRHRKQNGLKTTGIYGIVRNPIYLTDLLFSLGFAVMFRSIIGIALIPIWWAAFLAIVLVEETSLERALGQRYLDYKQQVKARIIPGLPV